MSFAVVSRKSPTVLPSSFMSPRSTSPLQLSQDSSRTSSPVDRLTDKLVISTDDADTSFYGKREASDEEEEDDQEEENHETNTQVTLHDQEPSEEPEEQSESPKNPILPSFCHQMGPNGRTPKVAFDDNVRFIGASPSVNLEPEKKKRLLDPCVERYKDVPPFSQELTCGMLQRHLTFHLSQIDFFFSLYHEAETEQDREYWEARIEKQKHYAENVYRHLAIFLSTPTPPLDPHIAELSKAIQMKLNNPVAHLGWNVEHQHQPESASSSPAASTSTSPERRVTRAAAKRYSPLGNRQDK